VNVKDSVPVIGGGRRDSAICGRYGGGDISGECYGE